MAWYRNGTVAVTNGSATVIGAGTDFVSNVKIGEIFIGPDRGSYEVAAIVSATQLTLAEPYQGPGGGGQSYKIAPTASFARDLALAFSGFKNTYGGMLDTVGLGMFGDGTVAAPGIRFTADQDTGMRRSNSNVVALTTGGVDRTYFGDFGATVIGRLTAAQADGVGVIAPTLGSMPPSSAFFGISQIYGLLIGSYGSNGDTWIQAQRVDGNPTAYNLNLQPSGGKVGIGLVAPTAKLDVYEGTAASGIRCVVGNGPYAGNVVIFGVDGKTNGYQMTKDAVNNIQHVWSGTAGAEYARFDIFGNFLLGTATASYSGHTINKATPTGNAVLTVRSDTTGAASAVFLACDAEGWSGTASAMWVGRVNNGRSINAAGTVNASGADYAEYMVKADGCGLIAKGDVCGVDATGRLTKSWAAAKSFVVKSTDPAYVGGDSWADHLPPKPEAPGAAPVAPVAPIAPASLPPEPVLTPREDGEDDESFTARAAAFFAASAAQDALVSEHAAYNDAVAAFPGLLAAHGEAHEGWEAAKAAYEVDLPAWEADLEKARQSVDRIAFAGQVPVNIAGDYAVGDYLVATNTADGGITVWAIAEADITFDQYRRRLGKVWAIREGRPWVDVQHG
ncbi:hypothetical protein NF699_06385 [Sphingomonadaceae bacterium OTU29LAMAA1]|nr:hypothetical protein NF699_06385 [Sphingomonadaceae bacterium OTU29LAMAA1]